MKAVKIGSRMVLSVVRSACLGLGVVSLSAMAESIDGVLSSTAETAYWATTDNWRDADGAAVSRCPAETGDRANLPTLPKTPLQQYISTGSSQTSSPTVRDVFLDVLLGDSRHWIQHTVETIGMHSDNQQRVFSVANPNDFEGYIYTGDSHATLRLPATASFVPSYPTVSAKTLPTFDVPSAATTGEVKAVVNGGGLRKSGAGELVVKGGSGGNVRYYVDAGGLTLSGQDATRGIEAILDDAFLHLDASDVDTCQTFVHDGRTFVTNWCDVRRNGRGAYVPDDSVLGSRSAYRFRHSDGPFLSGAASATCLQVVDFGSGQGRFNPYESELGPTNCLMFITPTTSAREVFWVARNSHAVEFSPVIGAVDYPTLQPAGGSLLGGSANYGAMTGEIYVDGQRTTCYHKGNYFTNAYHVVSIGSCSNLVLDTLGSDMLFPERSGGMRIGEVIIFERTLTRAERQSVDAYLRAKWLTGDEPVDAGAVFVGESGNALSVPAGRSVHVADLVATSGVTVLKTGGGSLKIGRVHPADARIEVRDGSVSFVGHEEGSGPDVADDAYVWLDADALTTDDYVTYEGDSAKYLTSWRDCRAASTVSATAQPCSSLGRTPKVVENASPTGRKAVNFGTSETSYMTLPDWGTGDQSQAKREVYAGFIAVRLLTSQHHVGFFSSSNWDMYRGDGSLHGRLLSSTYSSPIAPAALWTVNGVPTDPLAYRPDLFRQTTDWLVIAFSSDTPLCVDAMAKDRGAVYPNSCGLSEIGEFILFKRPVSDKERRQTEAYLMTKWLDKPHPDATAQQPTLTFATGVSSVLDFSDDATLARLEGGDGNIVKRGSGAVTLTEPINASSGISSISIEEGSLVTTVENDGGEDMAFHFDAADTADAFVCDDAGGRERVRTWRDVRRNGLVATNWMWKRPTDADYFGGTNVFRTTVTFPLGHTRPGVDFGSFGSKNNGGGMAFSQRFTTIREAMTVYQNPNGNWQCLLFGSTDAFNATSSKFALDYYRGTNGAIFDSAASPAVKEGYIWADGAEVTYDHLLADALPHFVNVAPTGDTIINAMSFDWIFGGGQVLFEQVGFNKALTAQRRAYWQQYLTWKWFGTVEKPTWIDLELAALDVAKDATLTLGGSPSVRVPALSGSGSVTLGSAVGVTSLTLDATDVGNGLPLMVVGSVSFGSHVTVTLTGDVLHVPTGEYVLLSASALQNVDLASWTLDVGGLSGRRDCSLRVDGGNVLLTVRGHGLIFEVR